MSIINLQNNETDFCILLKEDLAKMILLERKEAWEAGQRALLADISETFLNGANKKGVTYSDSTVFQGIGETIKNFPLTPYKP